MPKGDGCSLQWCVGGVYNPILSDLTAAKEENMGFFRQQEERLAMRLLAWQYQRLQRPLPTADELTAISAKIVDEAHRIARERGSNVVSIMKELISDWKK